MNEALSFPDASYLLENIEAADCLRISSIFVVARVAPSSGTLKPIHEQNLLLQSSLKTS